MSKFKDFVQQKKVQIGAAVGGSGALALAPSLAFAAEGTGADAMATITTALGTAISSVADSIASAIGTNLPVILGVAAIFIVVPAVWNLIRRFTH